MSPHNLLFTIILLISALQLLSQAAVLRSATLTPTNPSQNGATVTATNSGEITSDSTWNIAAIGCDTWHLVTAMDATWGFHPYEESIITFEIDSPATVCSNLLAAFTVPNSNKYTAIAINMGSTNMIVPDSNPSSPLSICAQSGSTQMVDGNVVTLLQAPGTLFCASFGRGFDLGLSSFYDILFQEQVGSASLPIKFTLTNKHPEFTDSVIFQYEAGDLREKCVYEAFDTNQGLEIYFAVNKDADECVINSLKITYSEQGTPNTSSSIDPTATTTLEAKPSSTLTEAETSIATTAVSPRDVTYFEDKTSTNTVGSTINSDTFTLSSNPVKEMLSTITDTKHSSRYSSTLMTTVLSTVARNEASTVKSSGIATIKVKESLRKSYMSIIMKLMLIFASIVSVLICILCVLVLRKLREKHDIEHDNAVVNDLARLPPLDQMRVLSNSVQHDIGNGEYVIGSNKLEYGNSDPKIPADALIDEGFIDLETANPNIKPDEFIIDPDGPNTNTARNTNDTTAQETRKQTLEEWFNNTVHLPYYELFIQMGFEQLSTVSLVTDDQLATIGIDNVEHRIKLMSCIKNLEENDHMH